MRAPSKLTVSEAWTDWFEKAKAGEVRNRSGNVYKPSTLRGYETSMEKRVLPELGTAKLPDLQRIDVQEFVDRLVGEGVDGSTIRNTLNPLQAVYRRALRRELVAINPTVNLEVPAAQGRRDRIAAPPEATALLAAVPDDERALWATALYAGLRRGELRSLRWSDIDVPGREINVHRGWDAVEGEIEAKSDAARRTVPIIAVLAPHLAAHKLATGRDQDALVFGMTATHPFDPSSVRRRARAAWKRAKLKPIELHECRHTFASLMIASGCNAKAIQKAMGHATITMTFDRYGHLMPGGRAEAAASVDAYMERVENAPVVRQ